MIPTLGYPSRTVAVLALRSQGLKTREIADRIGITVADACALTYASKKNAKRSLGRWATRIRLPRKTVDALQPFAEDRGVLVNELIQMVLDSVIAGKIINAVLDDGDAS